MANKKFSQFVDGGYVQAGDITVGLRGGVNTKFTIAGGPVIITDSGSSRVLSSSDANKLINFTGNGNGSGIINITINTGIAPANTQIFMLNSGNGEAIINATPVGGVTINGPIQFTKGNLIVATQIATNVWEITNGNSEGMYEFNVGFSGSSTFSAGNVVYASNFDGQTLISGKTQYPTVAKINDISQAPFGYALGSASANQSVVFLKRGTLFVTLEPGHLPGDYVYVNNAGALTLEASATGKTAVGIVLTNNEIDPTYLIYFDISFPQPSIVPTFTYNSGTVTVSPNLTGCCLVSYGATNFNLARIGSLSTLANFGVNYTFVNVSSVNVSINADTGLPDSIYETGLASYILAPGQAVSITCDATNPLWYVESSNPGNGLAQPCKAVVDGYSIHYGDLGFYLYNNESVNATIIVPPNSTMSVDANYWFEFACDNPAGCTLSFDGGDTVIGTQNLSYGAVAKINKISSSLPSGASTWQISQTNIPTFSLNSFTFDTSNISDLYNVNDTIALAGGTYSIQATVKVTAVHLATYNISNGGATYNVGDYITFSGTTPAVGYVTSVSSGAVTGLSFSNPPHASATRGSYTTTPSTLTQASTTGSGSGIVLNTLTWGTEDGTIVNPGIYTITPANPVSQASTSGSGTGAQMMATWGPTGTSGLLLGTAAYKSTTDNTKPSVVALSSFTNGNLVKSDSNGSAVDSGIAASNVALKTTTIPFSQYWVFLPSTNPATYTTSATLSNGLGYPRYAFTNGVTTELQIQVPVPSNYDTATNQIQIVITWYATGGSASQEVNWNIYAALVASQVNETLSSVQIVTSLMGSTDILVTATSSFFSPGGAPAVDGKLIKVIIRRVPGDTLSSIAYLLDATVIAKIT